MIGLDTSFNDFLGTLPRLNNQDGILLVYHSADNDGVASVALAEFALRLVRFDYKCKGLREITIDALRDIAESPYEQVVFLDIGSGNIRSIPAYLNNKRLVFILDHHTVKAPTRLASNIYYCNPIMWGYDIHREAVGASITYHFFKNQMSSGVLKDELRWTTQLVATAIHSDRQRFPFKFETAGKLLGLSKEQFPVFLKSSPHYLLKRLTDLIQHAIYGLNYDAVLDGIEAGVLLPRVGPNFSAPTATSFTKRKLNEDRLSRNLARIIPLNGSFPKRVREARSLLCEWICGGYGKWKNGCTDLRRRRCPDLKSYYELEHDNQTKILAGLCQLKVNNTDSMFQMLVPHVILAKHPIFGGKEAGVVAHINTALVRLGDHSLARKAYLGSADKQTIQKIHVEYNKELWRILSCALHY